MKNKTLKDTRVSSLKKGKVKGVGFFESIPLKIAGRIDGRRGLPRENDNGQWVSPHIEKEVRSYDEFSSRMWGQLQIEEEAAFARLGELMDSVVHIKSQLDTAKSELDVASAGEGTVNNLRKHGEGKLTDAQVAARRANERTKRLSPIRSRVSSLQAKLTSEIDEFSAVRAKIVEDNNSTRMVCNRVRDHLYQRLAVYWNSALRKHTERSKMPAVPCVDVIFNSEEVYMKPHIELMQKAELLSETIKKESEEVA